MKKRVRVLVVDDFRIDAQTADRDAGLRSRDRGGRYRRPIRYIAREKIKQLNPDVVTLDVEMPRMDGLDFLEKIMTLRPMPVVMVSSLTTAGAEVTLDALELGAVDFIAKPNRYGQRASRNCATRSSAKVKAAARARRAAVARDAAAPRRRTELSRGRHGSSRSAHRPAASRR